MAADLGTDVSGGKGTRGMDMHVMVYRQVKRSDKKGWVVVEVLEPRDETKEILTYKVVLGPRSSRSVCR